MRSWMTRFVRVVVISTLGLIAGLVTGMSAAAAQTVLRVGHILSESHPTHIALVAMAKELQARSDGKLTLEVFANGVLGTHLEQINQVRTGALAMSLVPGISPFQGLDGRLGVEEIPFLFASRDAAYAALDGPFGEKIVEILQDKGLHTLAFWENGLRHFTNNVRPIHTVADMKGIRFRSDTSAMRLAMFKEMGADAIGMAFAELFTGLQQGVVDGQENPLAIIDSARFYEVQKYLSLSGHLWSGAVLIINPFLYRRLDQAEQALLTELAGKYRAVVRQAISDADQGLIVAMREKGMLVNEVDRDSLRRAAAGVRDIYVQAQGDSLLRLLEP